VRLREHRHNLKEGLLVKSKLAQYSYRVGWDEARILEIKGRSKYRKDKESAHVECLTNPISLPNLDILPIWIPLIISEVTNSNRISV
jgi:hypothetical protein